MKLSVLICTIEQRRETFHKLHEELIKQVASHSRWDEIEVLYYSDNGEISIGEKRNALLDLAKGEYLNFVDDDDWIARDYIKILMSAIKTNPDCCSLLGVYTVDGRNPELFEHSIVYKSYRTVPHPSAIRYERYPNHLNCIKSSIAKQFRFPDSNFGEDTDWATQLNKSGLLKNEHFIQGVLYEYRYKTK